MNRIWFGSLAVLFLIAAIHPALAQDSFHAVYDTGIFAFEDGDFPAAEAAFKRALESDPGNPSTNHFLGKTYIKMNHFKKAQTFIEAAWQADPDLPELAFDRAFLYYRLGDYAKAAGFFQEVLAENPDRVVAYFYCGVCFYRNRQYGEADSYLVRAAEMSPDLKLKAFYYSGLCHYYRGQAAQALERMTYVKNHGDAKEIQDNATQWIEKIQAGGKAKKPYEIALQLAFEYDENVPLEPEDQDELYSDEDDVLMLVSASGVYNIVEQDTHKVGLGLSRYQTWHMALTEYNNSETAFRLYGQYLKAPFTYGLELVPSIYQIDGDDYLLTTELKPEISYTVNPQVSLWLSYTFSNNDYRQSDYDDRDGSSHTLFLNTVYKLDNDKGFLLGGLGYEANSASDSVYDYAFQLPYELRLGVLGTYAGKIYADDDPIADEQREDRRYGLSVSVSRSFLYDWLEIAATFSYTQNDSSINAYEYARQIVGIGLSARF